MAGNCKPGVGMGLGSFFGNLFGGGRQTAPPPSPGQLHSLFGPPQLRLESSDRIAADVFAAPYRGPLELDSYGAETPDMVHRYVTTYRTEPVIRAAVLGAAEAVACLEVNVLPGEGRDPRAKEAAEFVRWAVQQTDHGWHGLIETIVVPAMLLGWSLAEKKREVVAWKGRKMWGLAHCRGIDTNFLRLRLDVYRNVVGIVSMRRGLERYDPEGVILYTHNGLFSNPFGQSDLRATVRSSQVIEDVYRLWYIALKHYGLPYMVGKAGGVQRKMLEEALAALRAGGYAVTDKGDEIDVLNLAAAAATDGFEKAIHTHREDVFFAIRGAALPFLEGDGGANAHGDTGVQKVAADAKEYVRAFKIASVISRQLVPWLVIPNFGADCPMPVVKFGGTNPAEMKQQLDNFKAAQDLGLKLSARQVYETVGFTPPDPDDELKPAQPPGSPPGMPGAPPAGPGGNSDPGHPPESPPGGGQQPPQEPGGFDVSVEGQDGDRFSEHFADSPHHGQSGTFKDSADRRYRLENGKRVPLGEGTKPPASPAPAPRQTAPQKAPWAMSPQELKASGVTFFKTGQGSLYARHPSGQTIRVKSPHLGHEAKDVGLKRGSERTVYVAPGHATNVGMWQTSSAEGKRLLLKDGHVQLASKHPLTGKHARDGEAFPFSTEPKPGLSPLELNDRRTPHVVADAEHWSGSHPGSPIAAEPVSVEEGHKHLTAAAKAAGKEGVYEPGKGGTPAGNSAAYLARRQAGEQLGGYDPKADYTMPGSEPKAAPPQAPPGKPSAASAVKAREFATTQAGRHAGKVGAYLGMDSAAAQRQLLAAIHDATMKALVSGSHTVRVTGPNGKTVRVTVKAKRPAQAFGDDANNDAVEFSASVRPGWDGPAIFSAGHDPVSAVVDSLIAEFAGAA